MQKIASGGFEYQKTYFNSNENKLMVEYKHNNRIDKEEYSKFIHSCYFNMLTTKEAQSLLSDIVQHEKTKKTFELVQDRLLPELFNVKNIITNKSEDMLLKDIINDDSIIESLPAPHIRVLIRTYAILHKEEHALEEADGNNVGEVGYNSNIISFNRKKNFKDH